MMNVGRDLDAPITDGSIFDATRHQASGLFPEHVQLFRMHVHMTMTRARALLLTRTPRAQVLVGHHRAPTEYRLQEDPPTWRTVGD